MAKAGKGRYNAEGDDDGTDDKVNKYDGDSAWSPRSNGSTPYNDSTPYGDASVADQDRGVDSLAADLSCLCVPTRVRGPKELCARTGGWAIANADQFISSVIVAISLVPESISYALIAGLPPSAALQSAWVTNVVTSLVGGRPGMITSASGLAALLLLRLVRTDTVVEESGIKFVPYVIIFAGILQCVAAFVGLGRLVSTFPAPVVVGMVNGIAVLTLALQFRYAKEFPLTQEEVDDGWNVDGTAPAVEVSWNVALFSYFGRDYNWISPALDLGIYGAEVATAFLISMFLPKLTTCLPATLVGVLVVVAVEFGLARQFGVETPLIGDYGGVQVETPWQTIFTSDFTLPSLASYESWKLILGYGFAIFATQFTETAIALNVVDQLDESQGPGFRVLIGQGVANAVSGIMGGMGGSGAIPMSVLADRTFGTTCLSTFLTGFIMFVFITWGYPVINFIPLSAISGTSIAMVSSFIQWRSMVATFTTCLPSRKRDELPPQYNIARFDVFVMLFVTAACLIADFSTLLFFVMGLIAFVFAAISACRGRRAEKRSNASTEHEVDEEMPAYDQTDVPAEQEQEEGEVQEVEFPEVAKEQDEQQDNALIRLMNSAEEMIFPGGLEDDNEQRQKLS